MAPPQPSADTKPVKSQDDYINHGRDQLMSFLMTLRAIAIYGIATDWHDFDDAARVHAQDELTEAQLRDSCSAALDRIHHAPIIVANHERNARRLSELRRPDRGEGDAAADDDGAGDGNDGADNQAPDAPDAPAATQATARAATIRRQEGYYGEREIQAAVYQYIKLVAASSGTLLSTIPVYATDKGTRAVLNFVRRFGQRSERTTAAAEDKYNALLLLIKVGVNILEHLEVLKAQEKIVAWHQQRAPNFVAVIKQHAGRVSASHGPEHVFTATIEGFRRVQFTDINLADPYLAEAMIIAYEAMLAELMLAHPPKKPVTVLRTDATTTTGGRPGAGAAGAGAGAPGAACTWCLTYLQKSYPHTFEACRNRKNPEKLKLVDAAKAAGQLQVQAKTCVICPGVNGHTFGPDCPYFTGLQDVVTSHRAASAAAAAIGAPLPAKQALPPAGNPDFRAFLSQQEPSLCARAFCNPPTIDELIGAWKTDTVIATKRPLEDGSGAWHDMSLREYLVKGQQELTPGEAYYGRTQ